MNLPFREKENHLQRCLGSGYTSSQENNDFHNLIFTICSVATTRSLSVSLSLQISVASFKPEVEAAVQGILVFHVAQFAPFPVPKLHLHDRTTTT